MANTNIPRNFKNDGISYANACTSTRSGLFSLTRPRERGQCRIQGAVATELESNAGAAGTTKLTHEVRAQGVNIVCVWWGVQIQRERHGERERETGRERERREYREHRENTEREQRKERLTADIQHADRRCKGHKASSAQWQDYCLPFPCIRCFATIEFANAILMADGPSTIGCAPAGHDETQPNQQ